jgi:hypothetical protein
LHFYSLLKRNIPRVSPTSLRFTQEIATVSVSELDGGMDLAIFSDEGFSVNDHQMVVLQSPYHPRKPYLSLSIHCSALELTNHLRGVSDPMSAAILCTHSFRAADSVIMDEILMLIVGWQLEP